MSFRVLVSARAERELRAAAAWIAELAPRAAERWYRDACDALKSLAEHPERCEVVYGAPEFPAEVRQLLLGRRRSYHALFTIRETDVVILAIRHAAMREMTPEEL